MDAKEYKGCAICMYTRTESDPDPTDWFCDDDCKVRCTMSKIESGNRLQSGEPYITTAARPYMAMAECCHVPSWCPLGGVPAPKPEYMENFKRFHSGQQPNFGGGAKKEDVIDLFKDEYFFLSNFYPCSVSFGQYGAFRNTEAIYQMMKCPERFKEFHDLSASAAKHLGRRVDMREDWDKIKVVVMKRIVRAKFYQNPSLARKLIETGDKHLIEGNDWGDRFWGMVDGEGENHLGKILESIRDELKEY